MLVITTTMRMLDGVHGHTTHLGPALALHLVLVVGPAGLQDGLINTPTAGHNADHGAVCRRHDLLRPRRQLHARLLRVGVVGNDGGVVAGSTRQPATVPGLLFQVADNGTFGHLSQRHYIADLQIGLLAAVHELPGVHALWRDEQLPTNLVPVGIAEVHHSQRSAATGVVDDLLLDREINDAEVSKVREVYAGSYGLL